MNRLPFRLCLVFLAVLLTACGTSPPVHFYSLEPTAVSGASNEKDAVIIGLGPLRVPDYLKRTQMVTRGSGSEVVVHEQDRWVEPVARAMYRVLAANVDSQLDGVIVIAYPYLEPVQTNYAVLGQVDRFDSDASGQVLLQVQWAIVGIDEQHALIPPQRRRYTAQATKPGDPNAIAIAMNRALVKFGDDIAGQLHEALQAESPSE